jgi:hypothetical protein
VIGSTRAMCAYVYTGWTVEGLVVPGSNLICIYCHQIDGGLRLNNGVPFGLGEAGLEVTPAASG